MSKKTLHDRLESLFQELEQEQTSLDEGKEASVKGTAPGKVAPPAKSPTPAKRTPRAKRTSPVKPTAPEMRMPSTLPVITETRPEIEQPATPVTGETQISDLSIAIPGNIPLQPTYQSATDTNPALMNVPFRMPEENIGILEIEDDTTNRFWNEDERRLVEQVTDQLSLALENAYLFGETHRALSETERLYNASQAIVAAKSPAEVLKAITDCITSEQIGQCALALLDTTSSKDNPVAEIKAAWTRGVDQSPILGNRWNVSQIHYLAASNRDEPQVINDITNAPGLDRESRQTLTTVLKVKALASFPLRAGELFLGWMLLESLTSPYEFSSQEVRFFLALAGQAATALERMRLFEQTQHQLADLTIIQSTTSSLTAALSYDEIAGALLPKVANAVYADVVSMYMLQGDFLLRIGQYPLPESGTTDSGQRELPLSKYPLTQQAIETRQPVLVQTDDPRLQEHARKSFQESGVTANVTIPIVGPQGILGTLNVSLRQPGRSFTTSEIGLLQTMADQTAIAMQNARLFDQTQSALNRTNALYQVSQSVLTVENIPELLQEIADSIAQTLPADRAFLLTFDFDARIVTNEVIGGPGVVDNPSMPFEHYMGGLTGWAIREARPVISPKGVPDPRESPEVQKRRVDSNTGAVVVVPLLYHNQIMGTITVINRRDQHDFTEQDVELLTAMATQISVAIENRRLFEQTQASLAETELLYRASADLNIAKTNEDILAILRRSTVLGHPKASNLTINLFDRPWTDTDKPEWMIPISRWSKTEQPETLNTRQPISPSITSNPKTGVGSLFNSESPTVIEDADTDPRLDAATRAVYIDRLGAKSLLFAPLVVGGQWIGQIVAVFTQTTSIGIKETRPLLSLTGQAAVTIQNLRLLEETSRRANQLATAAEIARDTSSTLALDILLKRAVNAIRERYGYYHASIFLTDETSLNAVIRESTGKAGEEMKRQGHKLPVNSQSIVGKVIADGAPVIVNDVSQNSLHRPNPLLPETRAEMGIPLKSGDRVIGALDVQATRIDAFTQDDIPVLQTLADQTANAIENARLFAERRHAEESLASERNLLRTLIDNLPDVIYAKDADSRMMMANMAQARLLGAATPDGLIGRTDFDFFPQELASKYYADEQALIRSGQSLINEEEPTIDPLGNRKWLSTTKIPLRDSKGKITGFVGIGRDITESKEAGFERERLLAEVERRAVQLQAAAEVSRATSSILNPDELMQQAVNLVRDRFNLYYVGLFLLDDQRKFAQLKAGTGEAGQEMVKREHKLEAGGASMIGQCITNRQARIALDVAGKSDQEHEIVRFENPLLPNTRSELALPLISRGNVSGAMTVQSEKEAAFSEDDVTVLQTLADQLANAIENARLFAERQQAETALAYEQYLLRSLMDNLPDSIYFKDTESRFLRINRAQSNHLHMSEPSDAIGKSDFDFFGEEHARPAYEDEKKIIQTGIPIVNLEEMEVFPDGSSGWVSTTKMPLRNEHGDVVGTFGVSRDITERKRFEEMLANERNLLRTLIDNIPDLIYSKDLQGRFTMANMADARFLGTIPDELIGKSDFDFFPKELAQQYLADEQALILSGKALIDHEEPTINQATGEAEAWNLTTKIPLLDAQGKPIGLVGIGRDITERKRAEAERERLLQEVERRATQLQAAAEVSRATSSILNPNELMQEAVDLVRERFNFYYVGLFLLDETGKDSQVGKKYALLKAGTGEAGQEMVNRGHKLEVGGSSMIGWCVLNRQARVTQNVAAKIVPESDEDTATPILRFENPFLPATRSELALPLISRGQVRGAMTVQSEHENAFSSEDITVLQTLADQIAVAVDNASLFELTQQAEAEARQRLQDLSVVYEIGQALAGAPLESEEIANLITRYFIEVLDVPECVLSLYNPEEDVLRVLADLTRSEDYALEGGDGSGEQRREIIQKEDVGEIYHLSDYPATIELMHTMQPLVTQSNDPQADPAELSYMWSHGIYTMVSLPLAVKGTPFGVIRMQAWDRERHFTPNQINLAMTLANAAAVSLENARLYQEQRETTEKLREVDKMKSQFLANMSHELRTPLNSIIGFSRVILKGIDGPVSELQQQDLTAINSAGQHLLNLINDILDISKIEAGKMELAFHDEVNLHDIINGAMSFAVGLTKDKTIKLEKVIPAELPLVRADATRIRQVLINFLSNSTKFTEEGTITLKAGVQVGPAGRPEVLISVTDTGIGISQEDQKKLFLPFSQVDASATRKTGGSGLGLSISRLLIELHGGRVGVISDSGKGSTFYFTLPTPYTEPEPGEDEARVILAIDDDRQVISLYERYLKTHNYKVLALTDPSQAVERAREVNPFAITLDVMMPNRSGWQVLEALKADEFTRNIPVIVCSIVADQEKGFSLGAADYLTKPILEEDLVHSLDRLNRDGKIREVLAIDDDPDDLRLVQRILEESGKYQVRVANGGPEGLVAIRTRPPHAIILDLFMPGVDGFTLLETIRTDPALRDIPVIIFTAGDLVEEQRQRLSEFSYEMVSKGLFKENDLLTSIERALEHFIPAAGRG
jgi:PAS domain S-box-containing protein